MSVVAHLSGAPAAEFRRLRTLSQLLSALSHASALEDLDAEAMASSFEATTADRAAILLFDDARVIRFKSSRGLSGDYQTAVTGGCPGPSGTRGARPIAVPDVEADESVTHYREVLQWEGIRALTFVPLFVDAGVPAKPENMDTASSNRTARPVPGLLLVEDNPIDLFVIKDGHEAVTHLRELARDEIEPLSSPDDPGFEHPRDSGLEVLRELRAGSRCNRMPVIIVTSSVAEGDRKAAAYLEADEYFRKPASLEAYRQWATLVGRLLEWTGAAPH